MKAVTSIATELMVRDNIGNRAIQIESFVLCNGSMYIELVARCRAFSYARSSRSLVEVMSAINNPI